MKLSAYLLLSLLLAPAVMASADRPQAASSTGAPQREISLDSYLAELGHWSEAIANLKKGSSSAKSLRQTLPKVWAVRSAGEQFEVSTAWLDAALKKIEETPSERASLEKEIQAHLAALRREAEALKSTGTTLDPVEAQRHLETILRRQEFRNVTTQTWLGRLREQIGIWIGGFLQRFVGLLGKFTGGRRTGQVLLWLFIGAAFVLLALWMWRSLQRMARPMKLTLEAGSPARGKTWRDWLAEAGDAATAKNFREAVHAAYWAGIYRLEEFGVWQLDRTRTPREYLRLLQYPGAGALVAAPNPEHVAALGALTRVLESAWYGFQSVSDQDFRNAISYLEALQCRFPLNPAIARF